MTIDEKIAELDRRIEDMERMHGVLGPNQKQDEELAEARNRLVEKIVEAAKAEVPAPVDWNARTLADGRPVTEDHREINPATGQQKDYVVLSAEERARGFVRPVRRSYRHLKCGAVTSMSLAIAETYAREPRFYSGTFCTTCRDHFPVGENGEFIWISDGTKVGS